MRKMKRTWLMVSVAALICVGFFLTGCAKTVETAGPVTPPAQTGFTPEQANALQAQMADQVKRAEAAANRAEASANRSEAAARSAEQSANKAEAMADKAESIFMQKMKK